MERDRLVGVALEHPAKVDEVLNGSRVDVRHSAEVENDRAKERLRGVRLGAGEAVGADDLLLGPARWGRV